MQKLSIYIPTGSQDAEGIIQGVERNLARLAGGASRLDIIGSWLNNFQVIVREPVAVLYTLVSEAQAPAVRLYLQSVARQIKVDLDQETVLVTVETIKEALFIS